MKILITLSCAVGLLLANAAQGIENLRLRLAGPNVVLSWPSVAGDTYLIRYKEEDLSTNTPWTVLATGWPAAATTNWTRFTHSNGVAFAELDDLLLSPAHSLRNLCAASKGLGVVSYPVPDEPPLPYGLETVSAMRSSSLLTQSAQFDAGGQSGPSPMDSLAGGPAPGYYEVVKVGASVFGWTNGMVLSGTVPVAMEFAGTDPTAAVNAAYLADASEALLPGGSFVIDAIANSGLHFTWNTSLLTNGTYLVHPVIVEGENPVAGRAVSVTILNGAWTPNFYGRWGTALYAGVQTPYTAGTWGVAVYDENHAFVGGLGGVIGTDGFLEVPGVQGPGFYLDTTDGQGNQLPYNALNMEWNISATSSFAPYTFTNTYAKEVGWNFFPTAFGVADIDVFGNGNPSGQNDENLVMSIIYSAELTVHQDGVYPALGQQFQVPLNGTWGTFLSQGLVPFGTRDFVYFGHGSPNLIGDANNQLTVARVSVNLTNGPLGDVHPYRFVFLNGCETANGLFPEAFGISKTSPDTVAGFLKLGMRPRAFMGWSIKKTYTEAATRQLWPQHEWFLIDFWTAWASLHPDGTPWTLWEAYTNTYNHVDGRTGTIMHNDFTNGMIIYGAKDLNIAF